MIELLFVACLKTMPDQCEERSFAYLPEMSLHSCMVQAQPQLAQWAETHPALTISRWTCQRTDTREVKA
jgi:hypothetical protein